MATKAAPRINPMIKPLNIFETFSRWNLLMNISKATIIREIKKTEIG